MKNLFIIGASLFLSIFLFSCKAEPQIDVLPDLVFKADIGGSAGRNIDFTLPMGTADTRAVNGAYSSAGNILSLNAMDHLKWNLAISVQASSFEEGTYTLSAGQPEVIAFNDIENGKTYQSKLGSLTFSKVELYQEVGSLVGGGDTYYVEGEFSATLEEAGTNPVVEVSISGSFKGVPYGVR